MWEPESVSLCETGPGVGKYRTRIVGSNNTTVAHHDPACVPISGGLHQGSRCGASLAPSSVGAVILQVRLQIGCYLRSRMECSQRRLSASCSRRQVDTVADRVRLSCARGSMKWPASEHAEKLDIFSPSLSLAMHLFIISERARCCTSSRQFLALNGKTLIKRKLSVAGGRANGVVDWPDRQPLTHFFRSPSLVRSGRIMRPWRH